MTTRSLLTACLVCVIALFAGNYVLQAVVSSSPIPDSYEAPRNPHFRRDWIRWTRAPEELPGDRRVVVISNSQGFLRENPDGDFCYTARLEESLDQRIGGGSEVLNWSIPGGKLPEMTVLAARAGEHNPSDIVLVTYTENLVGESINSPLSFSISDVPLLTSQAKIRELLSEEFRKRYRIGSVAPWNGAKTGYGALRWRTVEGTDETWDWDAGEPTVSIDTLEKTVEPWDEDSAMVLLEFVGTAQRAAPDARVWIVSMPLARSAWTPEAWAELKQMPDHARSTLDGTPGVRVIDAIDLVPDDLFYTHTHMRAEGHDRFARWLADFIAPTDQAGE